MTEPKPKIKTALVIRQLLMAIKNSTLYPSGHTILINAVTDLFKVLQSYLEHCSRLVIVVEANRLLSDGQILHEGPKNKENIAFLLHRDGVQWISFEQGIAEEELTELLDIFRRYRAKEEYDGGDIVTALWQADFFHIKYGTDDLLWKDEPLLDISTLKVSGEADPSQDLQTDEQLHAQSLASADKSTTLWELTEEEREKTRRMIAEQEQRDDDLDIFDILIIILHEQNEKEDYSAVLDLVRECFERTLARSEFSEAIIFLRKMSEIYQQYKANGFWAQAHLDDFFIMISGKHLYAGLHVFLRNNKKAEREQREALGEMIGLLPPQSIRSLGKLLPDINDTALRQTILKSIAVQAKKNIGPLASLTGNENDGIAIPAIGLLAHVNHAQALKILKRQIQSDQEKRRIAAVKAISRHPMSKASDFEEFLEDRSLSVVKPALAYLGCRQDAEAARLIMARIDTGNFSRHDGKLLLALYDCLGRCLSEQSVPYLQRQLYKIRWLRGAVGRLHRKGAAAALFRIKDKKAGMIFDRASKSIRFSVRNACRQARERIGEPATK
jgi:hypothetical protein